MVGIFSQACGDLDVLKSLEDLHVVIDTLFRSKSSLHAISTLRKAARQISHADMRCILSDFFFCFFEGVFSKAGQLGICAARCSSICATEVDLLHRFLLSATIMSSEPLCQTAKL